MDQVDQRTGHARSRHVAATTHGRGGSGLLHNGRRAGRMVTADDVSEIVLKMSPDHPVFSSDATRIEFESSALPGKNCQLVDPTDRSHARARRSLFDVGHAA